MRRLLGSMLLLLFVLLGAACGDSGTAEPGTAASESVGPQKVSSPSEEPAEEAPDQDSSAGERTIQIIDTAFKSQKVTVSVGTTVTWKQIGDQPHSASSVDGTFDSSPSCSGLDSEMCLGEGDTFTFKFEEPGTYDYYCRVHGTTTGRGMIGRVIVR